METAAATRLPLYSLPSAPGAPMTSTLSSPPHASNNAMNRVDPSNSSGRGAFEISRNFSIALASFGVGKTAILPSFSSGICAAHHRSKGSQGTPHGRIGVRVSAVARRVGAFLTLIANKHVWQHTEWTAVVCESTVSLLNARRSGLPCCTLKRSCAGVCVCLLGGG